MSCNTNCGACEKKELLEERREKEKAILARLRANKILVQENILFENISLFVQDDSTWSWHVELSFRLQGNFLHSIFCNMTRKRRWLVFIFF